MTQPQTYCHPTAEVHPDARIGHGTKIWNGVQVREHAVIGVDCSFGKDSYVDAHVVIGDRVRVQNFVSIFRGVTLGDDVFVGPHACFTNDRYPRAFNLDFELVHTRVERGASIGAGAIILCGVTIGAYAMIGIGAVVTRDVPAHALVTGNPATVRGVVCRCGKPVSKETDAGAWTCGSCGFTPSS